MMIIHELKYDVIDTIKMIKHWFRTQGCDKVHTYRGFKFCGSCNGHLCAYWSCPRLEKDNDKG